MSAYPPYPQAPVSPPRPPLPSEHRRAALVAGGWGFGLSTLGGGLIGIALAALLAALVLTWILGIAAASEGGARAAAEVLRGFEVLATPPVVALFVATLFLGAALVALGLVLSARILRRSGVHRPWAVTGAAWGVAVVASGFLGSVGSVAGNVASIPWGMFEGRVDVPLELMLGSAVVAALVGVVVNVVIGALAWWGMAHALRSR